MPRFSDMLDRKGEEIKQPPLLPMGRYLVLGRKHPEIEEHRSQKQVLFDRIRFEMVVQAPVEVDEDALAEFGKVQGQSLRRDFYYTTEPDEDRSRQITEAQIKAFLQAFGCWPDESMTMQEAFANFPNSQAAIDVAHRPDPNDPERFYLEIGKAYEV